MRISDSRADEASILLAMYEVSIRVSNDTLRSLCLTPFWEGVKEAARDQEWWFRRTEYLVKRPLTHYRCTDTDTWSRVYSSLARNGLKFDISHNYANTLLIRVLLEIGVDSDTDIQTVIRNATPEGLSLVLANPRIIIPDDHGYTSNAVESGNADKLRLILEDGRDDPGYDEDLAIRIAAAEGETEMVKLLLADKRVDPSASHNEAIYDAARFGFNDIFDLLFEDERVIRYGSSVVDGYGLENAILNRNLYIVSRIVSLVGHTQAAWSLSIASKVGDIDIVRAILEQGSEHSSRRSVGESKQYVREVRWLLRCNTNYYIEEALKIARKRGHTDIALLLEQALRSS